MSSALRNWTSSSLSSLTEDSFPHHHGGKTAFGRISLSLRWGTKKTPHTHTVSGAVQGLYLLELQGNQPVNHHISKCTSLINHHIHSFMAQVNWCMTDSLRLCSLFAISQVGLKERFHTKKKWSGDVTSCVHTQQRPHVVSLWKEQAMCYCVFSRRRRREKKKKKLKGKNIYFVQACRRASRTIKKHEGCDRVFLASRIFSPIMA